MSILNNISGYLTLTTPLHCATPSPQKKNPNVNMTETMVQSMILGNQSANVPFFPSNDIRGNLRRMAAKRIIAQLREEGPLSVPLYLGLNCGAMSAVPENDNSVEEIMRAQNNVYMGVFGGGTRLMRSGLITNDLIPILQATVDAHIVPEQYRDLVPYRYSANNEAQIPVQPYQLLHGFDLIRIDDVNTVKNPALMQTAFGDNAKEIVLAHQVAVHEGRDSRKKSKADADAEKVKKEDVSNMMKFEAIIAGTSLYTQLDMADYLSPAQKGLIMLSLMDLVNERKLGGLTRIGFGQFQPHLQATVDGDALTVDLLVMDEATGLYQLNGAFNEYTDAAEKAIAALTQAEMWAFFEKTGA